MDFELQRRLLAALERPHRLGMIGGDLADHVAHAASFGPLVAVVASATENTENPGSQLAAVDLGTGGGIPGIVLAALWPQWQWTLVDVRAARAQEVEATVARLGLEATCDVVVSAAQELGRAAPWRQTFDLAVARAFGPPALLAECSAGLLRVGGTLIVSEPPNALAELGDRWPTQSLEAFGLGPAAIETVEGRHFAVIKKTSSTPERYPRTPPRSDRGWPKPA